MSIYISAGWWDWKPEKTDSGYKMSSCRLLDSQIVYAFKPDEEKWAYACFVLISEIYVPAEYLQVLQVKGIPEQIARFLDGFIAIQKKGSCRFEIIRI